MFTRKVGLGVIRKAMKEDIKLRGNGPKGEEVVNGQQGAQD